jgi:uncharacterized protein (TIGR00369 family)
MPDPRAVEAFDPKIADGFLRANEKLTGLPAFLGARFASFTPGVLRAELDVRDELLTPFENMHGGVISALCDHVLGCVCYPHMKRGQWAATTEFKLNLLAPVTGGTVAATAEIVSLTKATAVVQIRVENDGRLVAIAQGTVLIRDPKPAA